MDAKQKVVFVCGVSYSNLLVGPLPAHAFQMFSVDSKVPFLGLHHLELFVDTFLIDVVKFTEFIVEATAEFLELKLFC